MAKHNLVSVDLAKNVFQVCGMTRQQKVTFNKSIKRRELAEFMANQPPVEVAMEACYSSHYWARQFESMGHTVKLLPARHVSPFVRGNKSDHNDAVGIAEAARRPEDCRSAGYPVLAPYARQVHSPSHQCDQSDTGPAKRVWDHRVTRA